MNKHHNFAANLDAIRKFRHQSLAAFADEIGIPKSTLQSVLSDGHTTLDTAIRIADALQISLDTLLEECFSPAQYDMLNGMLKNIAWLAQLDVHQRKEILYHLQQIIEMI